MTKTKITAYALAACLGLAAWAAAASRGKGRTCPKGTFAGRIISLKGKPRIKSADGATVAAPALTDDVCEGDVIKTGKNDGLAMILLGGSEFRVNSNSEFTVESGGGGTKGASLFTRLGEAWTRRMLGNSDLQIRSSVAVASVRGTEADVAATDQRLTTKVYEGHVVVMNDFGQQTLGAGQMADASVGQAPGAPRTMGPQDKGTWQNGLSPQVRSLKLKMPNGKEVELKFQSK